jgi:hypothetical protein
VQNRLVPLGDLAAADKLAFYGENQGVFVWATEPAGDDPPVWVRLAEAGAPWRRESPSLSAFLIQLAILEAVFGAPFRASDDGVAKSTLGRLARLVAPVPLQDWESSAFRFYGGGGVVGFAAPEADVFSVWLGAKERIRFEPLDRIVGDWSNVS